MEIEARLNTPVLFLIFNRPDSTKRVFDQIRKVKPAKLYIAADGPRIERVGEIEKCKKTRGIVDMVDWECEVKTLFRENNLGCKVAVSSAISWFFKNEEEGIILEDDCVPEESFFFFCQTLLEKYKSDSRIMHIGGCNFDQEAASKASYYFSNYNHIWGWATWRRAWALYDVKLQDFPEFVSKNRIREIFGSRLAQYSWLYKFWKVYNNKIDTWDYQWTYAIWNHRGLSISPVKNLVSNIGFNQEGTHTRSFNEKVAELKVQNIGPIVHPRAVEVNSVQDKVTEKISYNITFIKKIVFYFLLKVLLRNIRNK